MCLWLYADPAELKRRLSDRADEMLQVRVHVPLGFAMAYGNQDNLLEEVRELTRLAQSTDEDNPDTSVSQVNFTHGVFQSIGKFDERNWMPPDNPGLSQVSENFMSTSPTHHRPRRSIRSLSKI